MYPLAPLLALGWIGVPFASLKDEWITPALGQKANYSSRARRFL
jgi:hypothetical protein